MEAIARLLIAVQRICTVSAQVALAFMMLSISYDAIMRYAFAAPTSWSFEVNGFLLIYIAMIPAADILRTKHQLRVEFFSDMLSGRVAQVQTITLGLIGLAFSVIMVHFTYIGAHDAWLYGERMPTTLGIPMVLPKAFLPIGFTLLALQFALDLLVDIGVLPPEIIGSDEAEGAPDRDGPAL